MKDYVLYVADSEDSSQPDVSATGAVAAKSNLSGRGNRRGHRGNSMFKQYSVQDEYCGNKRKNSGV